MKQQQNQYDAMLQTLTQVNELCGMARHHFRVANELKGRAKHINRRNKMKRAQQEAMEGSQLLKSAFNLIPNDRHPCLLREKYPQEMSRIGLTAVPIPNLNECEMICSEQCRLLLQLKDRVRADKSFPSCCTSSGSSTSTIGC